MTDKIYLVTGSQFFVGAETWAKGNAVHIVQQSRALAQQSALVSPNSSAELSSWFAAFEVDLNGNLILVRDSQGNPQAWHLNENGEIVDSLIPTDDPTPSPDPDPDPPSGGYEDNPNYMGEWEAWNGSSNEYQPGRIVFYNDDYWENTHTGQNTWVPGEFGWTKLP